MGSWLPRGLGARMAAIIGLCLLPAAALAGYALWEDRDRGRREAWAEAQGVARLAAARHGAMVDGARSILEALARFPEIAHADPARCDAVIASLGREHPEYSTLAVFDREGLSICSPAPFSGSLPDRAYFQQALAGEFAIGGYRRDLITGNDFLPLAQPIRDRSGGVVGVIVIGVVPSWLHPLFRQAGLPVDAHISIVDGQGTIAARYPGADQYVGRPATGLANWRLLQEKRGERLLESVGMDGVARLSAYVPLGPPGPGGQAYIAVGLSKASAIADSNRRLARNVVAIGLAAVLGVAAALAAGRAWVLVPARRLMTGVARFEVGDLTTRSGPPYAATELGELARAFDDMAARLQARNRDAGEAGAALSASEERFRQLVEALEEYAVFTLDVEGRVASWNAGAERMTGYEAREILGQPLSRFFTAEGVAAGEPETILRQAAEHGMCREEGWRVKKDGARFLADYSTTAVRAPDGRLLGYAAITRDVTERRAASAEIRDRDARLSAVVGSAMDAIITVDDDQHVTLFNAAAERIFRCPASEILGQSLGRLIPERFRAGHGEHIRGFGHTQVTSRRMGDLAELAGLRADGEEFPMEAFISQVEVGGRRIFTVVLRDITETRRREEKHQFFAERLRTVYDLDRLILEGVPIEEFAQGAADRVRVLTGLPRVSVAVYDVPNGDGTLLAASGVRDPDWEPGSHFPPPDVGDPEALARGEAQIVPVSRLALKQDSALSAAGIHQIIVVPIRADGELVGGFNIAVGADGPPGPEEMDMIVEVANQVAVAIRQSRFREEIRLHAVTLERQVAERTAQLKELSSEMEAFAYSVSHDLRAPLRAIRGIGQALLEDYGDRLDATGRDFATRVVRAAERMDSLIVDLLMYSRVSRSQVVPQRLSLETVVDDAIEQLEEMLALARASLTVERPLPDVIGERQVLAQVVANLLSNAAKFVLPGTVPRIRVWADVHDGAARLWVEDNGIGIAPEHRERIFRGLERLHGRDAYPGTGMGLAIVKKGVERCGGRAGVESANGGGSCFWIELPPAGTS